ncbi:FIST C-terminal domain-containing protein [Aquincola sp. S2]|uniref:FIST C-terminal domain-containing protein n=1 Tax=Pseudaquabacterium terrae TaxID=2732868 RepID=A0ABX2EM20_9BURK|nr:FIST N-terminal domain-containing protein [Aquabacterium terrae]NRF69622.1 FIST C-terminal domain-containing protein [Aquabacterium terrae]
MSSFFAAHATHPDAGMALALVAAQIDAQRSQRAPAFVPTLGLIYLTDHFAADAERLLEDAQRRWPGVAWAGAVGIGVIGSGAEYIDAPALSLMLGDLPETDFQLFNGRRPLSSSDARTALVHADPGTPELAELIAELSERTQSGYLFGGLASSRERSLHLADGVFEGGLSGVAFGPDVALVSRVTQGCQPVGPVRRITGVAASSDSPRGRPGTEVSNIVLELDGQPALPLLLADLGQTLDRPEAAIRALRATLVGLADADAAPLGHGGQFGVETRVRHLIGIDPARDAVAIADLAVAGEQLTFCRRDAEAARRDLVRVCSEIREEVEALAPDRPVPALLGGTGEASAPHIAGAIYVSCAGRGGPHFGSPSAEALIVQRALGDVPLVGFFAGGEIGHRHLYGYTGVLTVFVGR